MNDYIGSDYSRIDPYSVNIIFYLHLYIQSISLNKFIDTLISVVCGWQQLVYKLKCRLLTYTWKKSSKSTSQSSTGT